MNIIEIEQLLGNCTDMLKLAHVELDKYNFPDLNFSIMDERWQVIYREKTNEAIRYAIVFPDIHRLDRIEFRRMDL